MSDNEDNGDDGDHTRPSGADLHMFKGGGQYDGIAEALRSFRANYETFVELQGYIAGIQKAKYDALVAEGFTESQALELAKSISM